MAIAIAVALLLSALLLPLLVPARVVLHVAGDTERDVELALSWRLLLLHGERRRRLALPPHGTPVPPRIAAATPAPRRDAPDPARAAPPTPEDMAPRPSRTHGRAGYDRLADLERTIGVVRRLVARRALRVSRVHGWLEFALHDVAETGRAFGLACALATLLDPDGRLALQPRWDTADWLAADLVLELRVQPLRAVLALLAARFRGRASDRVALERATTGDSLAA